MRIHLRAFGKRFRVPGAALMLFAVLLQGLVSISVSAQEASPGELLTRALGSYARALDIEDRDQRLEAFHRAEMLFGRVVESGSQSPELYANLGNAALQAERLGPAVLAYRRALLVEPSNSQARQNLEHARGLLPVWVPRPSDSQRGDGKGFPKNGKLSALPCSGSRSARCAAGHEELGQHE